jgi:UDP-N-acetylglucosamine 4,6-dehydratase
MKYLILGGTGTLGKAFLPQLLAYGSRDDRVRILARHEHTLQEMEKNIRSDRCDFIIGDVRDKQRMKKAMDGIDIVFHFAAMKTVDGAEYNPWESLKTNVYGTQNVVEACLETNVKKAIFTSTDKSVAAYNTYGRHKAVAEDLFIKGNIGKKESRCIFSCVRYGNVLGSQGSVVEKWDKQDTIEITDPDMTRFWMTPKESAKLVLTTMQYMYGGEIYVPNLKSSTLGQLSSLFCKPTKIIGRRPGEKHSECLYTEHESYFTYYWDAFNLFIIYPAHTLYPTTKIGDPISKKEDFTSENTARFTKEELKNMLVQSGYAKELELREWIKSRFA